MRERPVPASVGLARRVVDTRRGAARRVATAADGTVTTDSSGIPVAYTVASGDITSFIVERFGFWVDADGNGMAYLWAINHVRRNLEPGQNELDVGDVLNLSPYTITSVGSIGGQVRSGSLPTPAPPQH
jgi:hypothetical protein